MKQKSILLKTMFLLFALVSFVKLSIAQVTYTFSNYPAGEQYAIETHVLDADVTLYTVECHFTTELRVYSNSSHDSYFYTNALPLYIESLSFNMGHKIDNVNIYGSVDGDDWELVGTIAVTATSYNDYTLSFGDENYNYFKFDVAGTQQIRVKSMTINYKTTGPQGEAAQAPVITPTQGLYVNPVTVTITTEQENGTIYYTTDGTTPTEESDVYTDPFEVSTTTTVKAVTIAEGYLNSSIISATYSFPTAIENIAAFKGGNNNIHYGLSDDVTFVYANGAYTYVKDESAALLIYDNTGVITTEYEEGDQISNLVGKRTVYASQVEMVPSINTEAAESNTGTVTPISVTISDLLANYEEYDAQLVKIEDVVFNYGFPTNTTGNTPSGYFYQGTDSMLLYSRFDYNGELEANANVNVTGFVGVYNSTIQIYPRNENDIEEFVPVLEPQLIINKPLDGAQYTSMDSLDFDVQIANFELGTDGYMKVESSFLDQYDYPNPMYFDEEMFSTLVDEVVLLPIPAGEYTFNVSLVDMDSAQLDPAVAQTVTITITKVPFPTLEFSPNGGTFADSVEVTINVEDNWLSFSTIFYTVDGTEPTAESEVYTEPFKLYESATVKAMAVPSAPYNSFYENSDVISANFSVVNEPVLAVNPTELSFNSSELTNVFTVSGAHLEEAITISNENTHFTLSASEIENPNTNTTITVTFDGAEPAEDVVTITSGELSATVTLTATAKLPAPVFASTTTISDSNIVVTMTCATAGATIYYTIDGTEPSTESDVYAEPIALNEVGTYTVKAFAAKDNWENSDVTSETYQIIAPSVGDEAIYATGFEAAEGFTATQVYNNTSILYFGNEGEQWGTYYGTPATNNAIDGSQSMQMRWYSSASGNLGYAFTNFDLRNVTHVTFSAANSNGLKVKVSHSVDGGTTYSEGETFNVTSVANEFDYVVSETGEYDYVRLKFAIELPATAPNSTSRLVIDNVTVYGIPGLEPTTVAVPVITPASNFYYEPQNVTITCETENAVIRYTVDGTEPTEASTLYSAPFTVNATTTIKAKAWKEDFTPSFVSTATISFPIEAENIAAFKANSSNDVQQITSDVTFVFRSGSYMFVEDNSGALLIYDNINNPVITTEYQEGDVINGGIYGRYKYYNGLIEMEPTHNSPESTSNVTVTPSVASVVNIKDDYETIYESKLVRINGVTFIDDQTFVQNGDTMKLFDRFNTVEVEITEGMNADIIGFINYSTNYGYQIYPRSDEDIIINTIVVEQVADPVISTYPGGEFNFLQITCETEGADIYYTIDETTPTEEDFHYTSPVPLQLNHMIIKAIAMKEGMDNSNVVTFDYLGIIDRDFSVVIYPNPASDMLNITSTSDGQFMIDRVEVYNALGQIVKAKDVNGTSTSMNIANLSDGRYIVKIISQLGTTATSIIKR